MPRPTPAGGLGSGTLGTTVAPLRKGQRVQEGVGLAQLGVVEGLKEKSAGVNRVPAQCSAANGTSSHAKETRKFASVG